MKTISEMRKSFTKKDFIVDNLMKSKGLYCLVARPKVEMQLQFDDSNFALIEQSPNERKLNLMDLQLDFQTFATDYNGRFVIIDMFSGIDMNNGYDLNNYHIQPNFNTISNMYCGKRPIKSVSIAKKHIGNNIDFSLSDVGAFALSLLGIPKNIILKAFVKHKTAIVPTSANPAIENNIKINTKKSLSASVFNIEK